MTTLGNSEAGAMILAIKRDPRPDFQHVLRGTPGAPVLVLCDPPNLEAARLGLPTSMDNLRMVAKSAMGVGFKQADFLFVALCPPLPPEAMNSASRKWRHVQPYEDGVHAIVEANAPKVVVTLGELASRVMLGRAVAITKARGQASTVGGRLVVPMLSPGFIGKVPEHRPTFDADWLTLAKIKDNGWLPDITDESATHYEWCTDISALLTECPTLLAVDTETTGLIWHDPAVRVLTVQLTWRPGHTLVCPVDPQYWPAWGGKTRARSRLLAQLKRLLEDPAIRKVGHNFKFDVHMLRKLGIDVRGWTDDTQLLAFALDENMMEKSLDECTRRWVPELAGYADLFNQTVDKSKMVEVPHEKMLPYAGGDTDACYRLFRRLEPQLMRDRKQYVCYARVLMPAIKAFCGSVERHGMLIDIDHLRRFEIDVSGWVDEEFDALIRATPAKVRRKHLEARQELKFSRPQFVRDILFSEDGFGLTPVVFTATTMNLAPEEREPSTSANDHLPFFTDRNDAAGEYVRRLIDFQKTEKLLGTFIRGFYKYISPLDGRIHPSYLLHVAVTGRSASRDPNGQNFPKRGRWAKLYQQIFKAAPGWKLVSVDLSQIELRIAAWMARDPRMLAIYREYGDIHTATAKAVSRLTDDEWDALTAKQRKDLRTKAKAVNFGFLYGMGWKKFLAFAKTDYGVDYTPGEAEEVRRLFFETYAALPRWHAAMRDTVRNHGYVRALHGARRNLPSINSNDEKTRSGAERQAINSPVQRFASDLGLIAMARFCRQADPTKFRMLGFIHDALVMEVREGYEQEGIEALLWALENPPLEAWFGIRAPLPILAEAEIGLNAGQMLEFADLPAAADRPEWFTAMGFDTVRAHKPDWWNDTLDMDGEDELQARLHACQEAA